MPANNPRPPRRSWKDDQPAGARPGQGQRGWHKEPAASSGPKGPILTRRGKIALAVGGLLLGVVVIAVVLWLLRPVPAPVLVLVGAGYEQPIAVPENVAGTHALDQLQSWRDGYNADKSRDQDRIMVERKDLTTESDPFNFDAVLKKNPNPTKVIVFVAAHGAADTQGAYLIPNDANPRNNAYTSYRVTKALAALKKLPKDTNKLLILDTTTVESDPALGLLHNDFTRALLADPALKEIPNLAILVASDEDQRSWVSEEWGTTIFAHFVVEGLKGAAEVNGRVTAKSLADYVGKEVEQWARDNRAALQTPRLFDDANITDGMELVLADKSTYKAPSPAELPEFTEPPGLRNAWATRDKLGDLQPSPAVYTPHLWRRYLDTLKRYEDLLRANDPASATTIAGELDSLVKAIHKSQRVEHAALANSLAMPAAFGWSLDKDDVTRTEKDFNALWPKAKPEEYGRKLKDWQENVNDPLRRQLLRVRLDALLLRQALSSEADFNTACDILSSPAVNDSVSPYRPAEAHFALMVNRYLPKDGRKWPAIKKALEVRLQAEEAALGIDTANRLPAYSEQVLPWIKSNVEGADKSRRDGEDLLFALAPQAVNADVAADKARQDYTLLQQKAATVRQALAVRDHALAELPYYTAWLGTLPLSEDEEKPYLELWDKVHGLCALLDKPQFDKIDGLAKPAAEIDQGMRTLRQKFKDAIPAAKSDTQHFWHDVNNLLLVPFIDAERRLELLSWLRGTSHHLNATKASGVTGITKEQNAADQDKAARRRGRLALAMLGKHHPASKDVEAALGRSLVTASERLGEAYRQAAQDVYARTEEGRKEPLEGARAKLRPAALESLQLSGAAAAAWPALDPVGENRRVDLHDLLVFQAKRTFDDYWAGDEPKQPFYRDAGNVYLSAAEAQVGADADAKKARLAQVNPLKELLAQDDTLTPRWYDGPDAKPGPARLHVTDEGLVPRSFQLVKAAAAPAGIPVVWTEPGKGLKPEKPEDLDRRALLRDKNEPADAPVTYQLVPIHPDPDKVTDAKDESRYRFTGFFRGRQETLDTTAYLYHRPEVTSYQPEFPATGRLAIKSNPRDYDRFAAANSELVIVVDYSFSMTKITKETEKKPEAQQRSRKQEALAALERCLKQVPEGVKVTLVTFSQDTDNGRIVPQWRQVEWDPSAEAVGARVRQLSKLKPTYDTPLVGATVEAKKYFTPGFRGAKSVLVLTDGGDNYFLKGAYKDLDIRKTDTMTTYLRREFDGTGILVNVIGIETDYLDPRADKEEIDGLKEYKPAIEAIGGRFIPVKDSATLAREIESFLLQIHYWVDGESGKVPPGALPEEGGNVSRRQENLRWTRGLEPGTFMVSLQTNRLNKRAIEQRVRLEGGDALVLRLLPVPGGNKFLLRHELYAELYGTKDINKVYAQAAPEDKAWLVSVLQNQMFDKGRDVCRVELMAAIEKRDDPAATEKTALRLARPRFVWFNVATKDAPGKLAATGLRFYPLADYPAAAYSLDVPEWKKNTESVVDCWWTEDAPPDCGILRPESGKRLMDLKQHALEVRPTNQDERTRIVVESISPERRNKVELKPNDFKNDVDCVVVRLRWDADVDKGRAFFAMLPDEVGATGAEHRFFLEAGKYTGVFYNVSPDKLKTLDRLILYSVEGAKQKAQKVTNLPVGKPNTDARPEKPQNKDDK